jgi:glyoxylate carboligase
VQAQAMAREFRVPVVVEVILERVTNIARVPRSTRSTSLKKSTAVTLKASAASNWPACSNEPGLKTSHNNP